LELRIEYNPSYLVSLRFYSQFEYLAYDSQDIAFFDQIYFRSDLKTELNFTTELEFSLTPHLRRLTALDSRFAEQDYTEYSVEPGIQYIGMENIWLNFSYEFGLRDYSGQADDIFSDHKLHRLNLLFDLNLWERVNIYLLSAIDWERHRDKQDNTTLYLISSSIEYTF
jgi:hypothetical protein